jgi:uncharacterized lipoprotein YddW (UPF0748 family)
MSRSVQGVFFLLSSFFLSTFFPHQALAQLPDLAHPKWEVRAVWITTAAGADWPKSHNAGEQKKSLVEMFDKLETMHFNTVFFQVRPRGNTFYKSQYEPWSAELTGKLGEDPGWDPLKFAIDEAHKRGMELHAWFNVAKVSGPEMPPVSTPLHIVRSHPDWVQQYKGEWWIDMGLPEVRAYTEKLVMEIVNDYDIDGIHFDYARYPGQDFNDESTFLAYGDGMTKDEWRRNNITTFVREMYEKITERKPWVKVGSAPVGIYRSISGAQSGFAGYDALDQDARLWMKEQIQDYIVPQLYWDAGEQHFPRNDPDFRVLCADWAENSYGRQIYTGIGAYKDNVQKEIPEQIIYSRSVGNEGQAFFRYANIVSLPEIEDEYEFPALIPPMPWKDSIAPLAPQQVTVTGTSSDGGTIKWLTPPESDFNTRAYKYVVYRSDHKDVDINDPKNILAIVPAPATEYEDRSAIRSEMFYAVTALDRGNNESPPGFAQGESIPPEVTAEDAPQDSEITNAKLFRNYPDPFHDRTYIAYELGKRSHVQLTVFDDDGEKELTLVDGIENAGTYVVSVDGKELGRGMYTYLLKAGSFLETKKMERGE